MGRSLRSALFGLFLAFLGHSIAYCDCDPTLITPTYTPRAGFAQLQQNSCNWGYSTNANWGIVDSSMCVQGANNTFTAGNTFGAGLTISGGQSVQFKDSSTHIISMTAPSSANTYTLTLPNDGTNGQVIQTNGSGVWSFVTPSNSAGSSALAVTTGTSAGFNSVASSPTAVITAEKAQFNVSLAGGSTAYLSLNSSSVTLQGNTFNQASTLVKLNSSAQIPALDGSLLTGLVFTGQLVAGDTHYYQNPSSGTFVDTFGINASTITVSSITVTNLTAGQCVQTGAGGILSTSGGACVSPTGTIISSGIVFGASTNLIGQATNYLNWDNTNHQFLVGTADSSNGFLSSPALQVRGAEIASNVNQLGLFFTTSAANNFYDLQNNVGVVRTCVETTIPSCNGGSSNGDAVYWLEGSGNAHSSMWFQNVTGNLFKMNDTANVSYRTLNINPSGSAGKLSLFDSGGTHSETFQPSGSLSASYTFTLPATAGLNGQILNTDGTGVLGWVTPVSAGSSALGVNQNTVSITTPTAQLNFSGSYWNVTANGSTATISTNDIHSQNSLQAGTTAFPDFLTVGTTGTISHLIASNTESVGSSSLDPNVTFQLGGSNSLSSGNYTYMNLKPGVSQSATAGYTILNINAGENSIGTGTRNLINAGVGGGSVFSVSAASGAAITGPLVMTGKITNLTNGSATADALTYGQVFSSSLVTLLGSLQVPHNAANGTTDVPVSMDGGLKTRLSKQVTTGIAGSATTILTMTTDEALALVAFYDNTANWGMDLVMIGSGHSPSVVTSYSAGGTPAARTYSSTGGAFKALFASGTYSVNVLALEVGVQ